MSGKKTFSFMWSADTSTGGLGDILFNTQLNFLDAETLAGTGPGYVNIGASTFGVQFFTFKANGTMTLSSQKLVTLPWPYGATQSTYDVDTGSMGWATVADGVSVAGIGLYARKLTDGYFQGYNQSPLYLAGMKANVYGSLHHVADVYSELRDRLSLADSDLLFTSGQWLFSDDGYVYYCALWSVNNDLTSPLDPIYLPQGVYTGIATWKFRVDSYDSFSRVAFEVAPVWPNPGLIREGSMAPTQMVLTPSGRIAFSLGEYYNTSGYLSADLKTWTRYDSGPVSFEHTNFRPTDDGYFVFDTQTNFANSTDYEQDIYDPEFQLTNHYDASDLAFFGSDYYYYAYIRCGKEFIYLQFIHDPQDDTKPTVVVSYNKDKLFASTFKLEAGLVGDPNSANQFVVNSAVNRILAVYGRSVSMYSVRESGGTGVWTAVSPDDGQNWRNNAQVTQPSAVTTPRSDGLLVDNEYHIYTMSAVRTPTALTLVGAIHGANVRKPTTNSDADPYSSPSVDSGSRNSLIIANYQNSASTGKEQGVVFKRNKPDLI